MRELIHKISNILNMIKGFDAGLTSRVSDRIIVDYKDERYVVSFTKIENKNDSMLMDINTYL